MNLLEATSTRIGGIDLAWGEKKPDGLCLIWASRERSIIVGHELVRGDDQLLSWIERHSPPGEAMLLCFDAPLIVPNPKGGRPVDREITSQFGKYHAGCHSANAGKCARPLRIAQKLREIGFEIDHDLASGNRIAAEVYPHPATIHFFSIDRIVKYKKGVVAGRREEFQRLQHHIMNCLRAHFPELEIAASILTLLSQTWSKNIEDQTDSLICALIGYLHWRDGEASSIVAGDITTGFILLPARLPSISTPGSETPS